MRSQSISSPTSFIVTDAVATSDHLAVHTLAVLVSHSSYVHRPAARRVALEVAHECKGSLAAILGYYYVIRSITYITQSLANPVPIYSILPFHHNILTTHVQLSTRLSPSI